MWIDLKPKLFKLWDENGFPAWLRGQSGAYYINKWAKPLPKFDLPPSVSVQKARAWHDLAVQYWQQTYGDVKSTL